EASSAPTSLEFARKVGTTVIGPPASSIETEGIRVLELVMPFRFQRLHLIPTQDPGRTPQRRTLAVVAAPNVRPLVEVPPERTSTRMVVQHQRRSPMLGPSF